MGMEGVKRFLKLLMAHEDPKFWINEAIKKIDLEKLKEYIKTGKNPLVNFLEHEYMKFPLVEERIRELLATNWATVEYYLLDPNNLKEELAKREDIAKSGILERDETAKYLNKICNEAYWILREFVYKEREHILEILKTKPKIRLRDLIEVAGIYGINLDMAQKILSDFEKQGIIAIYVELKQG